jgi:hypothetical protein
VLAQVFMCVGVGTTAVGSESEEKSSKKQQLLALFLIGESATLFSENPPFFSKISL